eukprot:g1765.t1
MQPPQQVHINITPQMQPQPQMMQQGPAAPQMMMQGYGGCNPAFLDPLCDPNTPGLRFDWDQVSGMWCSAPEFVISAGTKQSKGHQLFKGQWNVPLCSGDVNFKVRGLYIFTLQGGLYLQNVHKVGCCDAWFDIVAKGAHVGTGRVVTRGCCGQELDAARSGFFIVPLKLELKDGGGRVAFTVPFPGKVPCCDLNAPIEFVVLEPKSRAVMSRVHFFRAQCCSPAYVTADFEQVVNSWMRLLIMSFAATRAIFIVGQ